MYEEARQYILVGDYDNAEKSLKKCIKKNATNTDAVLLLADLYDGQSRQDDAINMILDCIDESEKNARNDQLYKRIIQLYVSKGDISAAIDFSKGLSSYIKTRLSKVRPADLKVTPKFCLRRRTYPSSRRKYNAQSGCRKSREQSCQRTV